MKVLVINSGSSSLKYQLIDVEKHNVLAKGLCDRIGLENSYIKYELNEENKNTLKINLKTHKDAVQKVLNILTDTAYGKSINDLKEIDVIGHRIVHGGEYFNTAVLLDEQVKELIEKCNVLAPLHNPPQIMGIEACKKLMPETPQVVVFDTAFHQTIPEIAYMYALPFEYYEKYKIRKYGFHGTSHKYVASKASKILNKPLKELKIITCHLGNGSSITAIKNGVSIDTSMGFTPLDGLVMGTRCGSIDPAIVTFLMEKENIDAEEMSQLMNKKSGLLALSKVSSDLRDIEKEADLGNKNAKLACETFSYNVKKYIGSYTAIMNGLDIIVFTAGIGENSYKMRELIASNMDYLGISIDSLKNKNCHGECDISSKVSKVKILVVPTNEEYMIAFDSKNIIENNIRYT